MGAILRIVETGVELPLEDFNLIGRSQDATIRLQDGGISRQHATIRREGNHWWITDLGSANGSYVNDVALTAARAMRTGDRVQLGTLVLVFDQDDDEDGASIHGMQTQMLRSMALHSRPRARFISLSRVSGSRGCWTARPRAASRR